MELSRLYQELSEQYRQEQLTITIDQYESCFWSVFRQLYQSEITIRQCTLNYYNTYIDIQGQCGINLLNQGRTAGIRLLCYQKGDDIWIALKLNINENCRFSDLFTETSQSRVPGEGVYEYAQSILAEVTVKYPELTTDSDHVYAEYPFSMNAGISFPSGTWGDYGILTPGSASVKGFVSLLDETSIYGNAVVKLEVPLVNRFSLDILKNASLLLKLYTGVKNPVDTEFRQTLAGADLSLQIEFEGITTPVDFSIPMFDSTEVWRLNSSFEKGFALSEGINFLLKLLKVDDLFLPPDTPIDFLKLYQVNMRMAVENGSINGIDAMSVLLASSQPWVLPIPWIRLQDFILTFEVTYGKNLADPILTGEITGTIKFNLGETTLSLKAKAYIPSMDMEAGLVWGESDWDRTYSPVTLTDLLSPFQAPAPNQSTGLSQLARLDVYASLEDRAFAARAEITDVFRFTVGNFQINLTQILVEAELSASVRNASIYGRMGFGQEGTTDYFELYAMASYLTGIWKFEGGLRSGVVNIGKVLTQIFSIEESQILEELLNIEITELKVAFDSDGNQYAIQAGFHCGWDIFGQRLDLNSRMQLKRVKDKEDLYAAAMFALSVGMFQVVVQANDFYSSLRNYLFRIQYDNLFVQAVYATENGKDMLTISLGGETLGSLVEKLVGLWNPNAHFKLDAPWSIINKIDLSRFQLVINVTDETAGFYYQVDLAIPGLMKIEKIGIQYRPDEVSGVKKIFFALTGELLEQEYTDSEPLSWDAVDGRPPDASALNQKLFSLYYLGVGQHLKNDEAKNATSLTEALDALKHQLLPPKDGEVIPDTVQYDQDMNWLFGAEFKVDALRVGVVLNDPAMYGLMVTVEQNTGALSVFAGLYLELLYRKITDTIGMFKATVMLPEHFRTVQLGIVTLKIGQVSFEVYTNGNFYIDAGFPHNADFSKSFVLEVYIFTGRGGIYLGVLNGSTSRSVPQVSNGAFSTVLQLGVGLSFGLGRSFDFGIAKGGLSLEVFGIFEGVLGFFECKDDNKQYLYYKADATVGVYGRLYLSVDFKVISISASVEIKAYAQLVLEAYKAMIIALDLSLELEAKVKILFIKVSFSYCFHEHVEFVLGSDSAPPWKLAGNNTSVLLKDNRLSRAVPHPLFAPEQLTPESKTQLAINLLPLFSAENPQIDVVSPDSQGNSSDMVTPAVFAGKNTQEAPNYCVAFIPLLDIANQKLLIGLLSDWLLSRWEGAEIDYDPGFKPDLADQLTYRQLYDFLQENAVFSFTVQDENEEQDGAAIPMPPPVKLSWAAAGTPEEARSYINYWEESMVSQDYADTLTEYFRELNADPTYQPETSNAASGDDIPLAQLIFLDYFQMALRELIEQILGFFSTFSCQLKDSTFSAAEWEQIITDNPDLSFAPGRIVFPRFGYSVGQGDTLSGLADQLAVTCKELIDGCGLQTMLLRQKAAISLPEYRFDNRQAGLPVRLAAALFYVRYQEFVLENEYQDYSAKIRNSNPDFPMEDEIRELGKAPVTLPVANAGAAIVWKPLLGDTLVRLGKMCAFYDISAGVYPDWDRFLAAVREENGFIIIPQSMTAVDGDITIGMLLRRLIPDQAYEDLTEQTIEGICGSDILTSFLKAELINIPYDIVPGEPDTKQTAKDILADSKADVEELALALSADRSLLDPSQVLLFTNQSEFDKQEVRRQLADKTEVLTSALSRFLLQGLRIMNPWPVPQEGKHTLRDYMEDIDTLPMFKAMRQQLAFTADDQDWELWCQGGQEGCDWVSADLIRRNFGTEEIGSNLPDQHITMDISGPEQLPDFLKGMPCYPVNSKLAWNISGDSTLYMLNLLPANMCSALKDVTLEPVGQNEKGEKIATRWGTYLPVLIRKPDNGDDLYPVFGANAQDRLLLETTLNLVPESIHVMYQASQASGLKEGLIEENWDKSASVFMKTNLSVETHMRPVQGVRNLREEEKTYEYTAKLTSGDYQAFLRLLWECSVVGGGGYYLKLIKSDQGGLPDSLFDEEGSGTLYILIEYTGYPADRRSVNSSVTVQQWKDKLTYYEQYDESRKEYQPAFPPGCAGILLETEREPDTVTSGSDITRQLFHIVGYKVEQNQSYDSSHDSLPLVPQKASSEDRWAYTPVVPLYRYVTGGSRQVYDAIGKQACIGFEIRDILGNKADISDFSLSLEPNYNDFVIAIHEWPYQGIYYEITGTPQAPVLRITCSPNEEIQKQDHLTGLLANAYLQLMQANMAVTVSSSFFPGEERSCDIEPLRGYLAGLLSFIEQGTAKPDPLMLDIPLIGEGETKPQIPKQVFLLYTAITITRSGLQTEAVRARSAKSEIVPKKEDTEEFVNHLEAALPCIRVAQGDGKNQSLYAVGFGTDGAIQSIRVCPYDIPVGDGTNKSVPEFYALRPLSNQWITRTCMVCELQDDGSLSQNGVEKVYSNIDMELWANRFLTDIEEALVLAGRRIQDEKCRDTFDAFAENKRSLAEAITEQLEPLRAEASPDTAKVKQQLKDRLLRSLSDGYQIDLVALYRMEVVTAYPCRMTLNTRTEATDSVLQPGKLDINNQADGYSMFISAVSDWQAGLSPAVEASIQEVEYDIEDVEGGYQSSKWLRLFHPVNNGDVEGVSVGLSSDIPFPNLFKRCPLSPEIKAHTCVFGVNTPDIHDMLLWNYAIDCSYQPYEQDTLFATVLFQCTANNLLRAAARDLFDYLAQYDMVRDKLFRLLNGDDLEKSGNAFDTFRQLAQSAASVWASWLNRSNMLLRAQTAERQYECKIIMSRENQSAPTFQIIPLNGTEQVLRDLGAGDPTIETLGFDEANLDIRFTIGSLPLYVCQEVTPLLRIVRNSDLLPWEMNPDFIYRTALISKDPLKASCANYQEIPFGEGTLNDLPGYQRMVNALWEALELNGAALTLDINVSYEYSLIPQMENSAVRLPVTLYLGIGSDSGKINEIADNLYEWYDTIKAKTDNAAYLFDVTIYSEDNHRMLLHLSQLAYKILPE